MIEMRFSTSSSLVGSFSLWLMFSFMGRAAWQFFKYTFNVQCIEHTTIYRAHTDGKEKKKKTNKTYTSYSFAPILLYCLATHFGNKLKTDVKAHFNRHAPLQTLTLTHSCIPYRIDQNDDHYYTELDPPNPLMFVFLISCAHISTSQIHRHSNKRNNKANTCTHIYEHELAMSLFRFNGNFAHFDFEFLSPCSYPVLCFRLSALTVSVCCPICRTLYTFACVSCVPIPILMVYAYCICTYLQ